jgi:hypothetical protein
MRIVYASLIRGIGNGVADVRPGEDQPTALRRAIERKSGRKVYGLQLLDQLVDHRGKARERRWRLTLVSRRFDGGAVAEGWLLTAVKD